MVDATHDERLLALGERIAASLERCAVALERRATSPLAVRTFAIMRGTSPDEARCVELDAETPAWVVAQREAGATVEGSVFGGSHVATWARGPHTFRSREYPDERQALADLRALVEAAAPAAPNTPAPALPPTTPAVPNAPTPTPALTPAASEAAPDLRALVDDARQVRRAALALTGIPADLAEVLTDLGDDAQHPDAAKALRAWVLPRVGKEAFAMARDAVGCAKGAWPSGSQMRRLVLDHLAVRA